MKMKDEGPSLEKLVFFYLVSFLLVRPSIPGMRLRTFVQLYENTSIRNGEEPSPHHNMVKKSLTTSSRVMS